MAHMIDNVVMDANGSGLPQTAKAYLHSELHMYTCFDLMCVKENLNNILSTEYMIAILISHIGTSVSPVSTANRCFHQDDCSEKQLQATI